MARTGVLPANVDGGYNAIKGFVFQFDTTILQAFDAPGSEIGVERDQDIDVEDFYVQVKLRSGSFTISAISKAIRQIIRQFSQNTSRRYRLYGHFPGATVGDSRMLTLDELDEVLAAKNIVHEDAIKHLFLRHFEIVFAPDLEAQFTEVLSSLKDRYSLRTDDQAIAHHAILYRFLTDLVIRTPRDGRVITAALLDEAVRRAEHAIFHGSYERKLGKERYLKLLKSRLQTARPNGVHRQRLVVLEVATGDHDQDIVDFAEAVRERFYIPEKLPAPYLLVRGIGNLAGLKCQLWNVGLKFTDGTHFDGDNFRIGSLTGRLPKDIGIRLVNEAHLATLVEAVEIQEVIQFYRADPLDSGCVNARSLLMQVNSVRDAADAMKVGGRR